jgi:hypothetical protein
MHCWVQIGDLKQTHTESEKRERVPHVSTSFDHLSLSMSRVSTSLVHLTHVGPTCLTSGSTHATWPSTSGPCQQPLHQTETQGQIWLGHIIGHISTIATWQCVNGAQYWKGVPDDSTQRSHLNCACHMAGYNWSTSPLWAPPWHKSPDRWVPP